MNEDNWLEFSFPWTMMPLECAGEWISAASKSMKKTDPLYGKKIFVAGRHELEDLILVENDTDGDYAIMAYRFREAGRTVEFKTIEVIRSGKELAERLRDDHEKAARQFKQP